ncbi:cyclopropane-fatty-acyl-phospholipid synthase [Salvia divinorum]|uniref:Cyclopropane-fatty-acyl-phospholipid synthase n=1 Tax=Salvia divinorum TaxID=28513 RepID=A0ABD1GW33_SALDI
MYGSVTCNSLIGQALYPEVMELFESVGVDTEVSDVSYSVSLDDDQRFGWGTGNGLSGLFAQKKNVLNPWFWKMIMEIIKFRDDAYYIIRRSLFCFIEEIDNNPDIDRNETLGHFVQSHGYSELFQIAFLIPVCSSIWSCSSAVLNFSAYLTLSFLRNYDILELLGVTKRLTTKWLSQSYADGIKLELESRGCQVKTSSEIYSIFTNDKGWAITCKDGLEEAYDGCIVATHASDTLKILGKHVTYDELRILGAFQYVHSDAFLHHDEYLMPKLRAAWGSRNFLGTTNGTTFITYWMNNLQNISESGVPFLLTLNPPQTPKKTLCKWKEGTLVLRSISRYGFPEDGVKAGILAANGLIRKHYTIPQNPTRMVPSFFESGARILVTRFFQRFIATGCLILMEGGVILRVRKPQFYWKVATGSDLGFADAYIDGDIYFHDTNEGLLNFLLLIVANTELNYYTSNLNKGRGWWTNFSHTSVMASGKNSFKRVSRKNSLSQARNNISQHYDL